ncbi:glycosyltransferase family 39 protein, partial [Gammaproteobacteria bacterium]|nr:glycosyltransferase family 39 protein [Gammaproteobacteria bacterium]
MIASSRPLNLLIIFICFIPLLYLGIFDLDEGAFAATSLQMVKDSQYLIPMIGDDLRLEKPIFSYWIQALFLTIFGFSEYSLRAPSLIAALIWGYSFATFVKENNTRFTRSDILINFFTLPGIFIISFAATADAFLNLFITLALINLYKFEEQKKNKFLNFATTYIALGFLTKGFAIVAICGLVFLFYCFFNRKLNSFFSAIFNLKAWVIFTIIVSPWFVYLYMQTNSESVMYMLFGQSFGRFTNTFENHSGSFFYYLIVLPFITLPFFPDLMKGMLASRPRANSFELFLMVWFFVVIIFFSFSTTKLPHYLVYGLSPIAYFIEKKFRKNETLAFSLSALLFHLFIWGVVLGIPFYLSYLLEVTQTFELSKDAMDNFITDNSYKLFVSLFMVLLIINFFRRSNSILVKKMSAVGIVIMLTFWLMPFAQTAAQQDIKNLGIYANTKESKVSMYKVNKPSYAFYAQKKSYRGLREEHLILSRIDKESSFNFEYEVIMRSGNYFIFKIKSD